MWWAPMPFQPSKTTRAAVLRLSHLPMCKQVTSPHQELRGSQLLLLQKTSTSQPTGGSAYKPFLGIIPLLSLPYLHNTFDIFKQWNKTKPNQNKSVLTRKVLNYTGYEIAAVKFISLNWRHPWNNQLRGTSGNNWLNLFHLDKNNHFVERSNFLSFGNLDD